MARAQKLIIIAIVVFCFLCLVFSQNTADTAYAYSLLDDRLANSAQNPYIIATADNMDELSAEVLSGNTLENRYYRLEQDITLNANYNAIGNLSNQFKGIFDGNNKTITINIDSSTAYNGIFGAIGLGGRIKNLRVSGSIIGGNNTGSIAGYNLGTVENCINYASVSAKVATIEAVGGIAGINYGMVANCINYGTVCANKFVGGIVGKNMSTGNSLSTINGIVNLGNITFIAGSNSHIVGGLVGQNDGIVKNGYNYSLITNSGDQIGSIIGYFSTTANLSSSKNCYNNTSKSAINVIGANAQSLPSNYANYTMYDFLGKINLAFETGIMTVKSFDVGFGYFPMLTPFINEAEITNSVRHSIFAQGNGTSANPFAINNALQWDLFATNTYLHDYNNVYVQLNCDISQSHQIASEDTKFNGIFDGNNKNITLSISGSRYVGMFRYIGANGVVKNLNVSGWISASGDRAGSIAGQSRGTIQNITSSSRVIAASNAGGIVGEIISGNLENIRNSGQVEGNGMLGGIAGYAKNVQVTGSIINSGLVQGSNLNAGSYFGGIFGQIDNDSSIAYLTLLNTGMVSAPKGSNIGGLAGSISNGVIIGSMNIGDVLGNAYVGGIAGSISGGSLDSVGVVTNITGASFTCGLVGIIGSNTTITDSYFSGRLYKLPKSSLEPTTFRVLANESTFALTLNSVYYNIDLLDGEGIADTSLLIPNGQGVGANYVQLTNVNGSAHAISFSTLNYWTIEPMALGYGYYPVSKNLDASTLTIIKNAVKYNYFNAGDGTASLPFTVNKAQQLYNLSYLHNNYAGYASLEYRQTAAITLDTAFTPIGTGVKPFTGKYNGDYYRINNLTVSGNENSYYGLFGSISNADLQKIAIVSGSITGVGYLGSIAGYSANSTIRKSYSLINIVATGDSYSGGIIGYLSGGQINECFNAGRVNAINIFSGGIVGYSNAQITNSFNTGMVIGTGAVAGGIAGNNAGGAINACYNSGTVKVTTEEFVGGLAGTSTGTIIDCYTIAKIIDITHTNSGAIAGSVNQGVTNYIARSFYNISICPLNPHSATGITSPYAKTTAEMENNAFIESFSINTLYKFGLANGQDSHYAPRLTVFTNSGNQDIENYSALSARLRLYGWNDDSTDSWGSENNPYLISTRTQLVDLSTLTMTYNYTGYYFALSNDIDMRIDGSVANFNPIGSYTDALNYRAFNGTFDGKGYKLQYLSITSVTNYVGLFSMLGANGSVKNLEIDENSSIITTGNYVGSFVGRNIAENGAIDRCVSYALVQGNTNIGGIVGYTYNNTRITNCLFYGTITGNTYVYGVVGMPNNSVSNVTTTNSWYIVDLSANYLNNGYNSTLFIDGNGQVEVTTHPEANNSGFIVFNLVPDLHFKGYYMDVNNNVVSSNPLFYAINNTTLTSMYARFTLPVSANVTGGAGIVNVIGEGDYYCGQTVTVKVSFLAYDYFINIFNLTENTIKDEYTLYTLKNDGEQVWITFTMPNTFEDLSIGKIVNIELMATAAYITVNVNNVEYSGNANDASVTVETQGIGYFENIALRYYFGTQKTYTDFTVNAGLYEVRARLTVDGVYSLAPNLFLGIQSQSFTISAKQLTVNPSFDWTGITQKEYDGTSFKNFVPITSNIVGIIASDILGVAVYCTVNWSSPNAGENLDLMATNFTLSGSLSVNYTINSLFEVSEAGIGVITKKAITVTIFQSDLTHIYNNAKPVISNITVSGSLGEVILSYSFILVDNQGAPVSGWDNTWNAGRYEIAVSTANTNYTVSLSDSYYVQINPIVIKTVNYTGFNNLTYTSSNLAGGIKGTYSTLYAGTDFVNLTYYYYQEPTVGLTQVINAGAYQAKPTLNAQIINYVLAPNVNTLSFNVSKATRAQALSISIGVSEAQIDGGNIPLNINNAQNGTLSIIKTNLAQRGAVTLVNNAGSYELQLTAYGEITFKVSETNCQNYIDAASGEITLTINPKIVYIGIANRYWYYGDNIILEFQYSTDAAQNTLLNAQEFEEINNFVSPIYRINSASLNAKVESYEVKIMGASSNNCRFYTANTNYIIVNKRPVEITVSSDNSKNTKTYGDVSVKIDYSVKDIVTSYIIDTLPNGSPLNIVGELTRALGENVGAYAINEGTITQANNPNYDLSFNIIGNYEIYRKGIKLYMPYCEKEYGRADPIFKLELRLADGYTFVGSDNINSINVTIQRESGENVKEGGYNYNLLSYDGGKNYSIISIELDNKFVITKATVDTPILSTTPVIWGDTLSTSTIYGSATHLGNKIEGTIAWKNGSIQIRDITKNGSEMEYNAQATFTPVDGNNINTKDIVIKVSVLKRKLGVNYTGIFDYTYTGLPVDARYEINLSNKIDGTQPVAVGMINGIAKDVGEYTVTPVLSNDANGVYELDTNNRNAILRIYPAVITVSVVGGEIIFGDTFTPVINYLGFVGNENESVLTAPASVGEIPKNVGYYALIPSGAEAKNYTFVYYNSSLIIRKVEVITDNVKLKGLLSPEVNVSSSAISSSTVEYTYLSGSIDSAMGNSLLKPSKNEMVEYLKLDITGSLESNTVYEVQLSTPIDNTVTLYLLNADGTIMILTDYTVNDEGLLVFTSGNIKGIGVYKQKGIINTIIGYLPLAGIIAGVVLLFTVIIIIAKYKRKLEMARRQRRLR